MASRSVSSFSINRFPRLRLWWRELVPRLAMFHGEPPDAFVFGSFALAILEGTTPLDLDVVGRTNEARMQLLAFQRRYGGIAPAPPLWGRRIPLHVMSGVSRDASDFLLTTDFSISMLALELQTGTAWIADPHYWRDVTARILRLGDSVAAPANVTPERLRKYATRGFRLDDSLTSVRERLDTLRSHSVDD